MAIRLAREGWTVAASARREEELQELCASASRLKGRIVAYPLDIGNKDAVRKTVEEIEAQTGPIALALLNAGVYIPVDGLNLDVTAFEKSFGINVLGTVYCLAAVIENYIARRKGHVALVSSVTGYGGLPTSAAYGATKAALINMAETLEIELQPVGIRVTIVNPGFVDTPAQDELDFPKPFMVSEEVAARRIVSGLKAGKFEISFPRRFTFLLKFLNNFVPKPLYLNWIRSQTGWDKRNSQKTE